MVFLLNSGKVTCDEFDRPDVQAVLLRHGAIRSDRTHPASCPFDVAWLAIFEAVQQSKLNSANRQSFGAHGGIAPAAVVTLQLRAMSSEHDKPHAREQVILLALPPAFLNDLPDEDQRAITAMVGRPVTLVGYDETGSAELEFDDPFDPRTDKSSHTHTIWVGPEFIDRIQA